MRHGTFSGFLSGCDCLRCKRAFVRAGKDELARRRIGRRYGTDGPVSAGDVLAELLVDAELASY